MPFKWYPAERVLTQAFLWRMLDLEEVDGRRVDLVIATKFPSYVVRHPNKVVWLVHQFRQAYELDRTDLGQFSETRARPGAAARGARARPAGRSARRASSLAISRNVAERLERSTGLEAEVVLPPPQPLAYRCESYDDFVLSVGRLDRAKRVDLLLEAAAADPGLRTRDRRRRARPRAARDARAAARPRRPRRVRRPRRRRRRSPGCTRAAAPSSTRRSTRTTGWSRTRRSSPRSPS